MDEHFINKPSYSDKEIKHFKNKWMEKHEDRPVVGGEMKAPTEDTPPLKHEESMPQATQITPDTDTAPSKRFARNFLPVKKQYNDGRQQTTITRGNFLKDYFNIEDYGGISTLEEKHLDNVTLMRKDIIMNKMMYSYAHYEHELEYLRKRYHEYLNIQRMNLAGNRVEASERFKQMLANEIYNINTPQDAIEVYRREFKRTLFKLTSIEEQKIAITNRPVLDTADIHMPTCLGYLMSKQQIIESNTAEGLQPDLMDCDTTSDNISIAEQRQLDYAQQINNMFYRDSNTSRILAKYTLPEYLKNEGHYTGEQPIYDFPEVSITLTDAYNNLMTLSSVYLAKLKLYKHCGMSFDSYLNSFGRGLIRIISFLQEKIRNVQLTPDIAALFMNINNLQNKIYSNDFSAKDIKYTKALKIKSKVKSPLPIERFINALLGKQYDDFMDWAALRQGGNEYDAMSIEPEDAPSSIGEEPMNPLTREGPMSIPPSMAGTDPMGGPLPKKLQSKFKPKNASILDYLKQIPGVNRVSHIKPVSGVLSDEEYEDAQEKHFASIGTDPIGFKEPQTPPKVIEKIIEVIPPEFKSKYHDLENKIFSLGTEKQELRNAVSELEALNFSLSNKLTYQDALISTLNNNIDITKKEKERLRNERDKLEAQVEKNEDEYRSLIETSKANTDKIKKELQTKHGLSAAMENKISTLERDLQDASASISSKNNIIKRAEEQLALMDQLRNKTNTTETEKNLLEKEKQVLFAQTMEINENFKMAISEGKTRITDLENTLATSNAETDKIIQRLEKSNQLTDTQKQEISALHKQISAADKKTATLEAANAESLNKIKTQIEIIDELKKSSKITTTEKLQLEKDKQALFKKSESLSRDLEQKIAESKQEVLQIKDRLQSSNQLSEGQQAKIAKLETDLLKANQDNTSNVEALRKSEASNEINQAELASLRLSLKELEKEKLVLNSQHTGQVGALEKTLRLTNITLEETKKRLAAAQKKTTGSESAIVSQLKQNIEVLQKDVERLSGELGNKADLETKNTSLSETIIHLENSIAGLNTALNGLTAEKAINDVNIPNLKVIIQNLDADLVFYKQANDEKVTQIQLLEKQVQEQLEQINSLVNENISTKKILEEQVVRPPIEKSYVPEPSGLEPQIQIPKRGKTHDPLLKEITKVGRENLSARSSDSSIHVEPKKVKEFDLPTYIISDLEDQISNKEFIGPVGARLKSPVKFPSYYSPPNWLLEQVVEILLRPESFSGETGTRLNRLAIVNTDPNLKNFLRKISNSIEASKIGKGYHLIHHADLVEHYLKNRPPTNSSEERKGQGCGYCGKNHNLYSHDKDTNDYTCKECLDSHKMSSKRYTARGVNFYPIHESQHEHHKKNHEINEENRYLKAMTSIHRGSGWDHFDSKANIDKKFLRRAHTDYIMNRAHHHKTDTPKLGYLVGMMHHNKENMNDHIKTNMHTMIANHLRHHNYPKASGIDLDKFNSHADLTQELEDNPGFLRRLIL